MHHRRFEKPVFKGEMTVKRQNVGVQKMPKNVDRKCPKMISILRPPKCSIFDSKKVTKMIKIQGPSRGSVSSYPCSLGRRSLARPSSLSESELATMAGDRILCGGSRSDAMFGKRHLGKSENDRGGGSQLQAFRKRRYEGGGKGAKRRVEGHNFFLQGGGRLVVNH